MIPLKDENPTSTVPYVTVCLVVLNVFVFGYMMVMGQPDVETLVYRFSVTPARLLGAGTGGWADTWYSTIYTPVTSMFMHAGLLHIAGNMLFLWVFGDNVEDRLGHLGFLGFYLACGLAAVLGHVAFNAGSEVPMVGASGAVSGVLGAYMLMFPRAKVWTFVFLFVFWQFIRVPAVLVIGLWIILQFINGIAELGRQEGGVAWFAHIGGFIAGISLVLVSGRRKRPRLARR
jgi:membrane associated rhomboid family serine protease